MSSDQEPFLLGKPLVLWEHKELIISENGLWSPDVLSSANFDYHGVGKSMLFKYFAPS